MNLQKFTIKAQEAVQEAALCAQRQGQQAIEPEHLLNSILKVGEQVTQFIFQKLGVNPKAVAHTLEAQIGSLPRVQGGEPYLNRTTHEVLLKAEDFAHKAGDEFITLEHILLALLKVNSTASKILKDAGVTEKELQAAIKELRGGQKVTSQSSEDTYQSLNKYARTKKDKNGKRVECPFEVSKVSTMQFDLNAKYQPTAKDEEKKDGYPKTPRKAWTKPTEFSWLKESLAEEGKFYLFGKLVSSKSEFIVDGKSMTAAKAEKKLAEYLPLTKADESSSEKNKDIWLTVDIKNIKSR